MAIFGGDQRYAVSETTLYPFRTVVSVETQFPDGSRFIGSGALVGSNDVLTAAHLTYNAARGGLATSITVTPGRNGGSAPFGTQSAIGIHVHPEYLAGDQDEDIAVLSLNSNVGDVTGWLGYSWTSAYQLKGLFVESLGYPGDWQGRDGVPGHAQVYTSGVIDTVSSDVLRFGPSYSLYGSDHPGDHDMDLAAGQSGSPVIYTGADGNPYVVGVISYEVTAPFEAAHNAAIAIGDDFSLIQYWINWTPTTTPVPPTPAPTLPVVTAKPGFDEAYYLSHNPDVRAAITAGGLQSGVQHYSLFGAYEGRDPNAIFDSSWYLSTYTDVSAAHVNPLDHYMAHGWKEGRDPSAAFDGDAYLRANPDVAAAGANPMEHYILYGMSEGRAIFHT